MAQSIIKTLIIRLFLIIACVNIAISLVFYIFSVRLAETEFQSGIQVEANHLANTFTQQLWLFDMRATEQLAEFTLNNPDIRGIRLYDQNDEVITEKGELVKANAHNIKRELKHESGTVVGKMELAYADSNKSKQKNLILRISILTATATLLITILFILYNLRKHLVLPLRTLQKDMSQFADGTFTQSQLTGQKKEIQTIINVFNQMAESLFQREKDQKKLENELRQKYKMEAIGTMAGGIAHDFNNLLSIIIGNLELLKRKISSGGDTTKNIDNIRGATDRAVDMVGQILAFSRSAEPQRKEVDLNALVANTLKLLRSTTPTTVEIKSSIPDDPVFVFADSTQLQQVIINLCANAVHAMDERGQLLVSLEEDSLPDSLSPEPADSSPAYAKIVVRDTGIGMDEETLNKIFDPFFTTKDVGKGTGMGLSMVHGILKQHNGYISVNSKKFAGSEFSVYLPILQAGASQSTETAEKVLPRGTEKILLVDDEQAIIEANTELLTELGYQVTGQGSSEEALRFFGKHPNAFDLVLTDQTMPKLSGSVLAAELLKINPDIPIILTTGFSAKISEDAAKKIGIRAYLRKPLSSASLAETIRKVLDDKAPGQNPLTG